MAITHSQFEPSRKTREALGVNGTFIILTTLAVGLRLWVRRYMLAAKLGRDDLLIVVSAAFAVMSSVACLFSAQYGLGQNVQNVAPHDMVSYIKSNLGASASYQPAVAFTRLSILAFYHRHLKPRGRSFLRVSIITLSTFIVLMLIWGLLVVLLQCKPISYQWEQVGHRAEDVKGTCLNLLPFYYVHASFGLFCDLAVYAIPIRTLWKLKLPKRQRMGLVCVFGLGAFVCVASAVRIHHLHKLLNSDNPSVDLVDALNWSSVEINLGVVCASIPTYKPLLKKYFPSGSEIASSMRSLMSTVGQVTTSSRSRSQQGSQVDSKVERSRMSVSKAESTVVDKEEGEDDDKDEEEMVEWGTVVKERGGREDREEA